MHDVKLFGLTGLAVLLLCAGGAMAAPKAAALQTFGYLEHVHVTPEDFHMQAKLDTGADNSSINAKVLKNSVVKGQKWIEFEVISRTGARIKLRKKVVRTASIKRHSGNSQLRPVVIMRICLGDIERDVEVNLVDRQHLTYKILLGRSFLAGHALVDSNATFLKKPTCK